MTLSRRAVLRLGLGAGATPLLAHYPAFLPQPEDASTFTKDEKLRARPLPLNSVRLLGGPLKHAQDLDARYLLELEPDRMLAFYRERAGLAPKAEPYGGWDGGGRNLTGHIAGHYLSAVSLMWAATGEARFKERADYIVAELEVVQDAHGDGYLSALEGGRRAFGELTRGDIRSASFDLNGEWSPWYTLHKTYAGLRDAYRFTGNRTALEVEIKFAAWAERILSSLGGPQIQRMLNTEFGGMNEVMVDLYADTGDGRWLELSYKFEHEAFIRPLQRHQDDLAGTHGNTQVPKLIGSADRFVYTGTPADLLAAAYFWDRVVQHHSFATGGHGTDEYFGPPDKLSGRIDGRTAETCNIYNMLKLTRRLFAIRPDAHYADFHERALFNHILGSIDPQDGRTCYMVPVGRGVQREYQDMLRSFTCCVGTGMESHALHGDGIYYASEDTLWVNLYSASTAQWAEAGVRLTVDTTFPEGETAKLALTLAAPKAFRLALRRPYWAGDRFAVKLNGESVAVAVPLVESDRENQPRVRRQYDYPDAASHYVELERTWQSGDTVELTLPKSLWLEPLPDNPRRAAVLWGPLVLAGDIGPERARGRVEGEGLEPPPMVPVLVAAERPVASWLKPVAGAPMRFRTDDVAREPDAGGGLHDVDLVPFYRLHRRTYAAYWDLFTPAEWEEQKAEYVVEAERLRALEAATVAYLQPGETVFEREFNYQAGDGAVPHRIMGRPGRRATSWFSYEVPVDPAHPMTLIATYYSGDRRGTPADFEILVNGTRVAEQVVEQSDPHRFFDVAYSIPEELVRGAERVTVRFQAKEGSRIATVFGLRMIRGETPR
ncbi:MAG: glycoside hydrolase family 127 protein [Gemmatimonadota bacterium]|nr:MAG: glycoside hydrolase family 127 protein [Gemmatimonadota bacterium]